MAESLEARKRRLARGRVQKERYKREGRVYRYRYVCEACGEGFASEVSPGQRTVPLPRFCGAACYRSTLVESRACLQCGAWFSVGKASPKAFCSRACLMESRRRVCVECGESKIASAFVCWSGGGDPSVCRPCRGRLQRQGWEARRSPKRLDRGSRRHVRRRLLAERGACCEDCGCDVDAESVHLHHITPQAFVVVNDDENLKLLCPDCHLGSGWFFNHWLLWLAGFRSSVGSFEVPTVSRF